MDTSEHSLTTLFEQLGLPSDPQSIDRFIAEHRPLAHGMRLWEAPWWSPGQRRFLEDAIECDAEWAIAVDELDSLLHHDEVASAR